MQHFKILAHVKGKSKAQTDPQPLLLNASAVEFFPSSTQPGSPDFGRIQNQGQMVLIQSLRQITQCYQSFIQVVR